MTRSIVGGDRNDQQHIVPFRQAPTSKKKEKRGQRRLVLSEEDYTDKLSKIIQRDFFPDVSNLERQNTLLDCRLRGDAVGAVAVRRAARRLIENEAVIADQRERDDYDLVETTYDNEKEKSLTVRRDKHSIDGGTRLIRKRPRRLEEENVTGFHARATNEDDDEFDSNLKRDIQENRQRLEDVFQNNKNNNKSNSSESSSSNTSNLRLDMASDDFAPESNRIGWKEWNQPKMQNGLFFNPTPNNGSSSQQDNNNDKNDRNNSKFLLDNNDISTPSSLSNKKETSLMLPPSKEQTHLMLKSQLVEYIPKHSLEKKIVPNATRFPSKQHPFMPMPMVISKENGILNDDMKMDSDTDSGYMSSTDASTDLDAPLRGVEEERRRLKRKQRSDQQSYVVMTPQIIPGSDGNRQSPITTWGIAGTPIILSSGGGQQESESELDSNVAPNNNFTTSTSSSSASPFQISSTSKRERAAQKAETMLMRRAKLATSSSTSKVRKRKNKNIIGVTTAKKGVGSLTPAALSLLEKTKSTQSRSRDAFGSSLRTSYTPRINSSMSSSSSSVKHRRGGSQYSKRDHAYNSTPQK